MKLKSILKSLMDSHDVTLSTLAKATGVPKQTIHNWLCGTEPKTLDHVRAVAKYFGLGIEELCYGDIEGSPKKSLVDPIQDFEEEIRAGVFEVILRRVQKGKK